MGEKMLINVKKVGFDIKQINTGLHEQSLNI